MSPRGTAAIPEPGFCVCAMRVGEWAAVESQSWRDRLLARAPLRFVPLVLGRACRATGDARYAAVVVERLPSWLGSRGRSREI